MPKILFLLLLMSALGGCSSLGIQPLGVKPLGVKPWERDLLAKKSMQLDAYPIDSALDDHIYFSKEAASGGRSFGGGGCGCN